MKYNTYEFRYLWATRHEWLSQPPIAPLPSKLKGRCHRAVGKALKSGALRREPTCSRCGQASQTIAHHPDYSRPLDVVWLCTACHYRVHAELRRRPA